MPLRLGAKGLRYTDVKHDWSNRVLKPLADNVIIEPIDVPLSRKILIPDRAKPVPTRGRVVAVGALRTLDSGVQVPTVLKEGDEVVFHKHGAEKVLDGDGRQWLLAKESDILAVVEK